MVATAKRSHLKSVTFHRTWRNYNRGDVAGFSPHIADMLIGKNFATPTKSIPFGKGRSSASGSDNKSKEDD